MTSKPWDRESLIATIRSVAISLGAPDEDDVQEEAYPFIDAIAAALTQGGLYEPR